MGKAARWFRGLLGGKKQKSSGSPALNESSDHSSRKERNERGLVRSSNSNDRSAGGNKGSSFEAPSSSSFSGAFVEGLDPSKHAIAVAAATAAVAEAAIAAAQAAAEVVRLTSGGSRASTPHVIGVGDRRRELAATKIQSAFRAYLAKRALRALKALVKLQALVRGHIVRKQSADMLRRMQAMVRIQSRACANRACMSESSQSSNKSFASYHPKNATPMKYDRQTRTYSCKFDGHVPERSGSKPNIKENVNHERKHMNSNWLDHWMEETWNGHRDMLLGNGRTDDEKTDKILEIDTWKPHLGSKGNERAFQTSKRFSSLQHNEQAYTSSDSLPRHSTKSTKPNPNHLSEEVSSLRSVKLSSEVDQAAAWMEENSPGVHSTSSRPGSCSRRGPFTPAKSEYAQSFFGDYLSNPNYMANTESSRAKIRSQSAPRQRIQFEHPVSTSRFIQGLWDTDTNSERGWTPHSNFRSKAYQGSGHLDRPGTPFCDGAVSYSSTFGGSRY